eukprot:1063802-Lingulodinium_polyedra.AAC.1
MQQDVSMGAAGGEEDRRGDASEVTGQSGSASVKHAAAEGENKHEKLLEALGVEVDPRGEQAEI